MAKVVPAKQFSHKQEVGTRLRAVRLAKGWEGVTFAAMIQDGFTPQKLSNYEGGINMLPIQYTGKISALVKGADVNYLYHADMSHLDPEFAVKVSKKIAEIEADLLRAPKPTRRRKRA